MFKLYRLFHEEDEKVSMTFGEISFSLHWQYVHTMCLICMVMRKVGDKKRNVYILYIGRER